MSKKVQVLFSDACKNSDVACVGVRDQEWSKSAQHFDKVSGGLLKESASLASFSGKKGECLKVTVPSSCGVSVVLLVGFGEAQSFVDFKEVGGAAIASLQKSGVRRVALMCDDLSQDQAKGFTFGAVLRSYYFDHYKKSEKALIEEITAVSDHKDLESAYKEYDLLAESMFFVRDIVNEPGNAINPDTLPQKIKEFESLGLKVEVLGEAELKKHGMNAMLGVGQGSHFESRMVVMSWNGGDASDQPLTFVGKGVTFDSGGLSLKPADSMEEMKDDMGGAAVVIGLLSHLAKRKAKVNAVGLVGLVENMPSSTAQRPGDIVKTASGQTVEVLNTDAEGRLVLCDVMTYCQKNHKPKVMIDLATLTGAILIGLGNEYAGIFSESDTLIKELQDASKETGDAVWHMPFHKHYDDELDSYIADMRNIGTSRNAGSSKAAHFLKRFVEKDLPWVHIDIAGTAFNSKKSLPYNTKGATGYGVSLLDAWVRKYEK